MVLLVGEEALGAVEAVGAVTKLFCAEVILFRGDFGGHPIRFKVEFGLPGAVVVRGDGRGRFAAVHGCLLLFLLLSVDDDVFPALIRRDLVGLGRLFEQRS